MVLPRRELLQRSLQVIGALAVLPASSVLAACSSAPSGGSTAASSSPTDDVTRVYDDFVKKDMPGVSIDLIRAAKLEGTVTCYLLAPAYNKTLADAFQKTFPFIKVELSQLVGGPNAAKFMAEARAKTFLADVVQFSAVSDAKKAADEKFVLSYKLSSESEINVSLGVPGQIIPVYGELMGIAYNPRKIADADAKSSFADWKGLLDPRWDGKKFAVVEVMAGGTPQLLNYYFSKKFGTQLWDRMAKSGYQIYPGANQATDGLISGEADIGVGIVQSVSSPKWASGAPVHWVNARDQLVSPTVEFIVAGAPHPNAAKLFHEFAFTPTGQKIFGEGGSVSFRKGIQASGTFAQEPWYMAPDPAKYWSYTDTDLAAAVPSLAAQWRSILR